MMSYFANVDDPTEEITTDVEEHVPEGVQNLVSDAGPYMGVLIGAGISLIFAVLLTLVLGILLKQVFRSKPLVKRAIGRARIPTIAVLLMAGTALSVRFAVADELWWRGPLSLALYIAIIIAIAWWALRAVKVVEAVILDKYSGDGEPGIEDRRGRRVRTQVTLIGRILVAVIVTLAVAAVLLLNENVRGLGAGLLASAGVASVVVGLAMQSTLGNIFAGLQLAFTDSIRVGDVVIIEGNYGSIEEITLSTVVIRSWDDRRFIYPSAYFVATPFENWTRVGTALLGTVELEVDWRVPMDSLRARLKRLLATTDLWDGKTSSLQLTEALEGHVMARVTTSARNSGELWDLRCLIREDLVNYLRTEHPYAVMTQRMMITNEEALGTRPESVATGQFGAVSADEDDDAATQIPVDHGLFTGSITAVERNESFGGPGEEAYRERKDRGNDT